MERPFDPKIELERDSRFRKEALHKEYITTEHLDTGKELLERALVKTNESALTAHNFDKVMEHVRHDPQYSRMYSAGKAFEGVLRERLGVEHPPEHTQLH